MPYMFNRAMRLAPGNLLDSMAWAAKITEKVNAAGGPQFNLWSRVLSPEAGTISWSTIVGQISEVSALQDTLMADGGYLELAEQGARYSDGSGVNDGLGQLLHADPDGSATAQYASITISQLATGSMANGIALGVEIAQRVKSITGSPASFGASLTGPYGQVAWFVLSESLDQLQASNEAIGADADWVSLMDDRASKAFVAAASHRFIMRRLA